MCYCMENTGTKPAATDSFGSPVSPVGSGPTSPQGTQKGRFSASKRRNR